jgi:carboxypeptidase C (cathepsin A)
MQLAGKYALALLSVLAPAVATLAQAEEAPPAAATAPATMPSAGKATTHSVTVAGKEISYTAQSDFLVTKDDQGKPLAKFFHTSYTLPGADPSTRPIMFIFNGGPGSSSVWLHLGAAGPRKVVVGDDALPPPPPGKLADNPDSWLPAADLVFIDPVGTGFSRPEPGVDGRQFWSVDGDVNSLSEFIRLYLAKHNRWGSPKFLAGESYGTTRCAGLSNRLREEGIDVSGVVLVSAVLEFNTISGGPGNDLPLHLFLPSYTASAYFHKKLPADVQAMKLEDVLKESEAFAAGDYPQAIAAGATLPKDKHDAIAAKLHRLTGLSPEYIERSDLKVHPHRFMKELLADQRKIIGRYDATITGYDADPINDGPDFDPSYSAYLGPYTSAFNNYLRNELKFETDQKYEILAGLPWSYPQGSYVNTAVSLQQAMTENPHLRVMVCSGWQDLATPYFATQYTLDRLNLSPESRAHLSSKHYFGGHMMYHHPDSHRQLGEDVRAFIVSSTGAN